MQRLFLHYGVIIPALLFALHQILQHKLGITTRLVDSYLDPFCMGALAPALLALERNLVGARDRLHWLELSALFVILTITSEIIFPVLSNRFTQDWWDATAIFVGILWYRFTRP